MRAAAGDASRSLSEHPRTGSDAVRIVEPQRAGRKRDLSRDRAILDAALEALIDVGFEAMTIEMVAERARAGKNTVYRRWSTKAELVLAAVACLRPEEPATAKLASESGSAPSLRSDLLALIDKQWLGGGLRRALVLNALSRAIVSSPEIAEVVDSVLVRPSRDAYKAALRRAVDRGEVDAAADLDTLAQIVPSMAMYRTVYQATPVDAEFLTTVIDTVLLPAALRCVD